jgi:hypothetical protein
VFVGGELLPEVGLADIVRRAVARCSNSDLLFGIITALPASPVIGRTPEYVGVTVGRGGFSAFCRPLWDSYNHFASAISNSYAGHDK